MKRQKHRAKGKSGRKAAASQGAAQGAAAPQSGQTAAAGRSRRDILRRIGGGAAVVAALGGAGWYLVEEVQATIREGDLSRIGNGIPTVVQIHDPQCSRCAALQREARRAMSGFGDDELQFVVANIRTSEGSALARANGVGHVTLLLFDGNGKRNGTLVGNNSSDYLEEIFRRHIGKRGS